MRIRLGLAEAAFGLAAYAAYMTVRRAVWTDEGRARAARNTLWVTSMERRAGVFVEPHIQRVAMRLPALVSVLNLGYAVGNVGLSVGWLMGLFRRRDGDYRRERTAMIVAMVGALPIFLAFPMSPPRRIAGFVDTLASRGVDLDHPLLVRLYNPIAAMPSEHVAFAVVTGIGLGRRATTRTARWAWWAYPPVVGLVVVATGNHLLADTAAGAALGGLARRLAR